MSIMRRSLCRCLVLGIFIVFILQFNLIQHRIRAKYYFQSNQTSCNLSMSDSEHLICESDAKWRRRREYYFAQHEKNIFTMNEYENYFQKNWSPEFRCENEIRLGEGDGGKWMSLGRSIVPKCILSSAVLLEACDIEYLKSKSSCLVYSLGSGQDFQFEQSVRKHLPHCSIHTIDMKYSPCPPSVCTFHLAKLGNGQNGTKTLRQFMTDLNHTNSEIDILKIDIESSEYLFFHLLFSNNAINQNLQPVYIRQILIEVHLDRDRLYETHALFYLFNSQNYVIYHQEVNIGFPFYACEYGFLKLNRTFFRGQVL